MTFHALLRYLTETGIANGLHQPFFYFLFVSCPFVLFVLRLFFFTFIYFFFLSYLLSFCRQRWILQRTIRRNVCLYFPSFFKGNSYLISQRTNVSKDTVHISGAMKFHLNKHVYDPCLCQGRHAEQTQQQKKRHYLKPLENKTGAPLATRTHSFNLSECISRFATTPNQSFFFLSLSAGLYNSRFRPVRVRTAFTNQSRKCVPCRQRTASCDTNKTKPLGTKSSSTQTPVGEQPTCSAPTPTPTPTSTPTSTHSSAISVDLCAPLPALICPASRLSTPCLSSLLNKLSDNRFFTS